MSNLQRAKRSHVFLWMLTSKRTAELDYKEILLKKQAINQKPTVHFLMLFKITSLKYIQYTGVINTVQGLILPTYAIQNFQILQPLTVVMPLKKLLIRIPNQSI